MKKFVLFFMVLFTFMFASAEVDYRKPRYYRLPIAAQQFLDRNFASYRILDIDREDGRYEVRLSGDLEIKFDASGRWVKMKSEHRGVPYSALPPYVRHQIRARYPRTPRIEQVKRRRDYIEVKLSNHHKMKVYTDRPTHRPHPRSNRPVGYWH